jgi:hypothetical protein
MLPVKIKKGNKNADGKEKENRIENANSKRRKYKSNKQ